MQNKMSNNVLELLNIPAQWKRTKGKGVRVAVIDAAAHGDRVPFVNPVNYDPKKDGHWHASTTCWIVHSVASETEIYCLQWYKGGWPLDKCLQWCIKNNIDIINMSLNTPENDVVKQAIKAAYNAGIILVAAAGNSGYDPRDNDSEVGFPAKMDEVIAVAALDPKTNHTAGYSSGGPEVFTADPGNLDLPWPPWSASGTSFSAPFTTGMLALVKAIQPGLTPQQAMEIIRKYSKDIESPGKDDRSGYGLFVLPVPEVWVPEVQKMKTDTIKYWRVQLGAFNKKENAENLARKLQQYAIPTMLKQVGGLWKVQVGAFSVKENAEKQLQQIKVLGFNAFITKEVV